MVQRGLNIRGGSPERRVLKYSSLKKTIKSRSLHDRLSLFGWRFYVLLLRLASFGATSRPLSGLRGWGSLGLGGGGGCTLGHGCRTGRSGAIDSRVRTFVGVGLWHGRGDIGNLLVHKSEESERWINQHDVGILCRR